VSSSRGGTTPSPSALPTQQEPSKLKDTSSEAELKAAEHCSQASFCAKEVSIYALLSASILLLLSYALPRRSKPEHDSTTFASRNKRKTHHRKDEAPLKNAHAH